MDVLRRVRRRRNKSSDLRKVIRLLNSNPIGLTCGQALAGIGVVSDARMARVMAAFITVCSKHGYPDWIYHVNTRLF